MNNSFDPKNCRYSSQFANGFKADELFIISGSDIAWKDRYQLSGPNPMKIKYTSKDKAESDRAKAISLIEKSIAKNLQAIEEEKNQISKSMLIKLVDYKKRDLEIANQWKVVKI